MIINEEIQNFAETIKKRCDSSCELCSVKENLKVYQVPPANDDNVDMCTLLCEKCIGQLDDLTNLDVNHWHCLNESAWTQEKSVQILVWRLLNSLNSEAWTQDLLDQIYLEDDVKALAEEGLKSDSQFKVLDSNGTPLLEGDSVTIIKDLDVKGTNFVAKRGTLVKNIRLGDAADLVEGKVNKTSIFLKTCFLKKV